MAATLSCTPCCTTTQTVNVPGSAGLPGVNGTNGIDAYTVVAAPGFTVPAIGGTIVAPVASSVWMVVGQNVITSGPANFKVVSIPNSISVTLLFLGYPGDVSPLVTTISPGSTVSPSGILGGGWNMISKAADQAIINSAVLTTDTSLQFTMQANLNYRLRGVVFFDTTAAGDFKYAFTAPAAPTLIRAELVDCIAGGTPAELAAIATATPGSRSLAGAGTTGGYVEFRFIFQNGANVATFGFQFAQDTQTNDTGAIVRAGSWMEWAFA